MNVRAKSGAVIGPGLQQTLKGLTLGEQLADFARKTNATMNEAHRAISIRFFTSILFDTPVLTGMARGNWQSSMGAPAGGTRIVLDPDGAAVSKEIVQNITADYTKVAYFSNNLEYIIPLEFGWSAKSPEGMIRINAMRFNNIVKETIAAPEIKL